MNIDVAQTLMKSTVVPKQIQGFKNNTSTYISETYDVVSNIIQGSCDSVNEVKCWGES